MMQGVVAEYLFFREADSFNNRVKLTPKAAQLTQSVISL
jgi:hypothetical protein